MQVSKFKFICFHLICWYVEMGPIQESKLWLWSRPADSKITSSRSAPYTVHQMASMAWLMLMQMQQLMSGN